MRTPGRRQRAARSARCRNSGGWAGSAEPHRCLARLGTLFEGGSEAFLATVRDYRVMDPVVFEREFSLRRGWAPSFSGTPVSAMLGRSPELTRYETPLAGLFLTGAGTFPGAGVWGASGRNAATAVLRSDRRTRRRA